MSIRKLVFILLGVIILITLAHELELHLSDLEHRIQSFGIWAPLCFIVIFTALAPLSMSVDALCFAAGLLFPFLPGVLYMAVSTYLAAALIFVLGRFLIEPKVSAFINRQHKLAEINAAISKSAFKLMFLLRLTPLPFALLSYTFAVAPVRFGSYLAATSGILLYNAIWVYFGFTAKHITSMTSAKALSTPVSYTLLVVGLVIAAIVILFIAKAANRAIAERGLKSPRDNTD